MEIASEPTAIAEPVASTPPPIPPAWRMQVLTPNGIKEYRWTDVDEVPEEITYKATEVEIGNTAAPSRPAPAPVDTESLQDEADSSTDELGAA